MQQPHERRCCPHCCRHPEIFHQASVDVSDDATTAGTVGTASKADEVHDSDEDFVERDSEAWYSAEDCQDHVAMSEGSSEHGTDDSEDDKNDHNEDDHADDADDDVDNDAGQDTQRMLDNNPTDFLQVVKGTFTHESPIASLRTVLRSLDVRTSDTVNHARDLPEGVADVSNGPSGGTST